MKKILSLISVCAISSTGLSTALFTTSCSKSKKEVKANQDINIDAATDVSLGLNGSETVRLINFVDLSNVTVKSSDDFFVTATMSNDGVIIKALNVPKTPVTVTISASNANAPIILSVSVSPSIDDVARTIIKNCSTALSVLKIIDNVVGSSTAEFAKLIGASIPTISGYSNLISQLIDSLKLKPEEITPVISQIQEALTLKDYTNMNNQKAIDSSEIRIANALGVISGQYSLTDSSKAPVDWKTKNDSNQLKASMEIYSKSIAKLIDSTTSSFTLNKTKLDTSSTVYAICQIVGAANQFINYITSFDISKAVDSSTAINFNQITQVRNQVIDVNKSIDIKKLVLNIESLTAHKESLQSLIAILFAVNGDKDTKDKVLVGMDDTALAANLFDSDKKCKYDGGISKLLGTSVSAIIQSNKVWNLISGALEKIQPGITAIVNQDCISGLGANALVLLLNYLGNGINSDGIKIIDVNIPGMFSMKITLTGKDSFVYKMFDPVKDKDKIDQTLKDLNDPLGFVFNKYLKIEENTTLGDWGLLQLFKVDKQQINNALGPNGCDIKVKDIINAINKNLPDTKINLNSVSQLLTSLISSVDDKGSSLLAYVLNNISQIGNVKSDLWKYLGLVVDSSDNYSIKPGSLLDNLYLLVKEKSILALVQSFNDIVKSIWDLTK